ncbi:DUF6447 family protein [uncultured Thiohalocapsa sp.]|uniref:DUF6447 family protein n=1 Tax=uncultured Thiohalocapsa sp. TaxID=768990 RepID=UPI0025D52CCC|nr:DUF6447 family protein [uncultured Thiohalocapsa sp.]
MAEEETKSVTIDGQTYQLSDLSESVRAKILNIRFVDGELGRARNNVVVLQAARAEFARQLQEELHGSAAGDSDDTAASSCRGV